MCGAKYAKQFDVSHVRNANASEISLSDGCVSNFH